jgi:hypothetical protein
MPDATKAEGGVGCFIVGVLVGVVFAVSAWTTKDHPGGFLGLVALLVMCGFFGALVAVGSEANAEQRRKRRR